LGNAESRLSFLSPFILLPLE